MQNLPLLPESIPRLQEAGERQGLSLPRASPVMGPEEVKSGNGSYLEREKQKSGCTLKQTICDFTETIFEETKAMGETRTGVWWWWVVFVLFSPRQLYFGNVSMYFLSLLKPWPGF